LDEEPPDVFASGLNTFQAQRKGGIQLNVPCSIQKNVQKYQGEYDSYLRRVSHAAVGSFKPWTVAESLAEELIMEALADVAAEFQDVCEEYAEAIFTSEFLQPTQPPFASVS
ncbi:protein moonraker isoform X1, partial [Silurus meridionalis]